MKIFLSPRVVRTSGVLAATSQLGLACQLAVAREPTCKDASTTVTTILREQSLEAPASCSAP